MYGELMELIYNNNELESMKISGMANSLYHIIEDSILVKPIDYYYTYPIARSSKVMSECREISKNFLFTGIEKAS